MRDIKGKSLSTMLVIVTQRFEGKFDRGGHPYVLHCLKVMHYLRTEDEELMCVGLGHDLLEDTFESIEEGVKFLRYKGFSERVINGIVCMTRIPGETEEEYEARVMSNPDSIQCKLCDLRHNSDIRRLKGVREKDIARMVKYHNFYLKLKALTNPLAQLPEATAQPDEVAA